MKLHKTDIGRYHLGLFYSTAISGVPYEPGFGLPFGVSRENIEGTTRILTLLHECVHYLHDLALGLCINHDLLLDELAQRIFTMVMKLQGYPNVTYPIKNGNNISVAHFRYELQDIEHKDNLLYDLLYKEYDIDTHILDRMPSSITMSSIHLLEGIACIKSMFLLALQARSEEDLFYLERIRDDIPLLPNNLSEKYALAPKLFDATVGKGFFGNRIWNLRDWPNDVHPSTDRTFIDSSFIHIAEIALHIPPYFMIMENLSIGRNE